VTKTIGQQLGEAHAEIERLTALLPPLPAPGQVLRVGTKNGCNLYAHADGLADRGVAVGQMRSEELAAHVVQAVNAWEWGGRDGEGSDRIHALAFNALTRAIGPDFVRLSARERAAAAVREVVEREVRAKVAEEIEAEYHRRDIAHGAYLHAAQIARGEGQ
jgi:hypothetical protein